MTTAADNKKTVFDDIADILESNGAIDPKLKDRLLLMALSEFHRQLSCVPELVKRVDILERKNIWMWAEKHPKAAGILFAAFVILLSSNGLKTVAGWLGAPLP
jgi:hypothetical protein